jgi:hypothetical protein
MCVTWTPDSKGFYFTACKDYKKLLYFDVAAKKARTVVSDFNGMTHWPAVSPDGKRVAVVTFVGDDQKYGFQVVVYDSAGKELQRSRLAPPATQPPKSLLVCLFWAPKDQGDNVLFQAGNTCALVDLKADRFTYLGEETMLWVFGNSPIRPDGKGFFTCPAGLPLDDPIVKDPVRSGAVPLGDRTFHDWNGKKWAIELPERWRGGVRGDDGWLLQAPYLYESRWQKNTITVRGAGTELTVSKSGMSVKQMPAQRTAGGWLIQNQFRFGKDGPLVRVTTPEKARGTRLKPMSVQVLVPGAEPKTLIDGAGLPTLQPSPDGKLLAVGCLMGDDDGFMRGARLLVVDAQGEVLADIDTWKD